MDKRREYIRHVLAVVKQRMAHCRAIAAKIRTRMPN
jgi:hypothetical protein